MPAVIMVVLGLALMTGAESHYDTVKMVMQAVVGLGLFVAGLSIGKHGLTH